MNEIIIVKQSLIKNNSSNQKCPSCHSILKAKWFGFKPECVQPKCNFIKRRIKNE